MSAPASRQYFALLNYYLREKLWRHAIALCDTQSATEPLFLLWKAFASDMEGSVADALRDYKVCEARRPLLVPALIGMQIVYRRNKDADAVDAIETKLGQQSDPARGGGASGSGGTSAWSGWLHGACLLWHSGDVARAREVLNRIIDSDADFRDEFTSAQLIRGWVDLSTGRGAFIEKSGAMFDRVIQAESQDGLDIDATMGKVAMLERKNQFYPAQELLNKLMVTYPNFAPAALCKAKQLVRTEDWEGAVESLQKVLTRDPMSVEGLALSAVVNLVRDGQPQVASRVLTELIKSIQAREPRNGQLYISCAQCVSRLAGGNLQLLTLTNTMAEIATQLAPNNSEYASEVAYQAILRGDFRTASAIYKKASTASDGNVTPLLGLIRCTLQAGKYDEAAQQVEFLTELQSPQGRNAQLSMLTAMLKWRKDKNAQACIEKLDQAAEAHRQDVLAAPTGGVEFYARLNPDFMMQMIKEYLVHARTEPPATDATGAAAKPDPILERARRVVDLLLRHVACSSEAQLVAARIAFVGGDSERAMGIITQCLKLDHANADAHLLNARICLHTNNLAQAASSLDQALALDFELREAPSYNLLRGQVALLKGDAQEANTLFQAGVVAQQRATAMVAAQDAPLASKSTSTATTVRPSLKAQPLGVNEHVHLLLQLAQSQLRLKQPATAQATVRDAAAAFRDTPHAGRILIAYAAMLARTDVDQAIDYLKTITPTSEYFLAAKAQLAHLYLNVKVNRKAFARCYEELVEIHPSPASLMSLGDAYAAIQEPEKAIAAYEKARAQDPNNADLAVKIGRMLVSTHDFQRALRYYRDAVAGDQKRVHLRIDLAALLWRLGDLDRAAQTLREAPLLQKPPGQDDFPTAMQRVAIVLVLAKVLKAAASSTAEALQGYVEALLQARVYQISVLSKTKGESNETIADQKSIAATICAELGDHYARHNGADKAIGYYNEALKYDEAFERSMLSLAELHLSRGEFEGCEMQCNALLRVNPGCEAATVMLADLMYRKNRYEDAATHFLQLLEKHPSNYSAMVRYVQLLRRAGKLADSQAVFTLAENQMKPGQRPDAGLCYAKGLKAQYSGDARTALKEFNHARVPKDGPWAQPAVIAMIECYINPDGSNLWEDTEARTEATDNLKAAEKLLKDVRDLEKRSVLEGYIWIASKKRDNLDRALNRFYEIMSNHEAQSQVDGAAAGGGGGGAALQPSQSGTQETGAPVHVPSLVGMAITLQVLKQTPKARNHLKRLGNRTTFNADEDMDYERGYLLLASIYVEGGKFDVALDLLNKVLGANRSCGRAWEAKGLIFEKEQSYKDAAESYEAAWKLVNCADPGIGYKLAFNYLKAKKFVQAIDACHKVLEQHPNYPKIRKDVLEKARASIRP